MKFEAIQVNSAPEALVEQIRGQIRAGKLKPGESLPSQRELAKMFRVGLGTVREAFKILDVMGCVDILRGKGTFVAQDALSVQSVAPTIENALEAVSLAELMKAREVVESGAARIAAEKADTESIQRLREITSRMLSADLSSDAYYENDFRFHIAVAEASENQAVLEIVKLLADKAHHHINFMNDALGISLPAAKGKCVGSAVRVVDFIADGDAERAGEAMCEHLNTVTESLLKEFPGKRLKRGVFQQHIQGGQ
ncbi:MAG: FadR/GntR family transcriptional regulator [Desulfobacterales bacterium]|jgi:GntR family transcriptional repressor for pyruvate dehydrogenase complex